MQTLGGMVIIGLLVREWFTRKCFMGDGVVFRGDGIPRIPPLTRVAYCCKSQTQKLSAMKKLEQFILREDLECNKFLKIARLDSSSTFTLSNLVLLKKIGYPCSAHFDVKSAVFVSMT